MPENMRGCDSDVDSKLSQTNVELDEPYERTFSKEIDESSIENGNRKLE